MARPSEVQKKAWHGFLTAQARVTREIDRRLKAAGHIDLDVYDVLVTLELEPTNKLRMSELAERMVFSRSGLTRFIDRLVAAQLVHREACMDDRRGAYAVLTPKGRKAREAAWEVFEPCIQEFWADFIPDDDAVHYSELFDKMIDKAVNSV